MPKVHGILYKSLCVVVTELGDNEVDPQFGQIEDVIIVNNEVTLMLSCLRHVIIIRVTLQPSHLIMSQFTTLTLPTTSLHFMQEPSLDLLVHLRKL